MKKELSEVLFTSSLVRDALLLLNEGPKDIDSVLTTLKTSRQALYPQIKVLKEENIINHDDELCRLTVAGKMIVHEMVPLLYTLELLDDLGEYELDFIPSHLISRVRELYPCNVVDPSLPEICEVDKEFHEKSTESKSVIAITSFMFPNFSEIIQDYTGKGITVSVVVSAKLHDKLKCKHYQEYKNLIDNEIVKIYVHDGHLGLVSFTQNDYGFMLRLLSDTVNSHYDYRRIFFQSPASLKWGKDLFEHYKNESVQVNAV